MSKVSKVDVITKVFPGGGASMGTAAAAFGPKGIKAMDLVKQFNDHEYSQKFKGQPVSAVVTIKEKAFKLRLKTPSPSFWIKQKLKIERGSKTPGRESAGSISCEDILEIARTKMPDLPNSRLFGACKTIAGTARSMGIAIKGNLETLREAISREEQNSQQ